MGTPSSKNLLLGAGKVLFDRWGSDGNSTGLRHLGNVDKFDLKQEADVIKKKQSMFAAKTTYVEVVREITNTADITLTEFDPANIAMAFLGEEGVITQVAGTIASEKYVAYPGKVLKVNAYNISDIEIRPINSSAATIGAATPVGTVDGTGVVVSSGTYTGTTADTYFVTITTAPDAPGDITGCEFVWKKGVTGTDSPVIEAVGSPQILAEGVSVALSVTGGKTFEAGDTYSIAVTPAIVKYIAGTDYKLEASMLRSGLISIPETSSIRKGETVLVSYKKPEGTFATVAFGVVGTVEGYMLFAGDPTKGPCYNADLWHVSITPNGALPLIGDDISTFDVTVEVLDDRENHPTEPSGHFVKLK